jgi:phage terminase small subunit
MKPDSINVNASKLLADAKVSLRIEELRHAASSKVVATEARVIEELARIGLLDPGRMFADDGTLLPIKQMPADVRAAISSIEVEELRADDGKVIGRTKKVKLWDKNSAADKLLRHLGSYAVDNRQRASPFEGVSRDVLRGIIERLVSCRDIAT